MSVELGNRAETLAAEHLKGLGLKVVARNYRSRWSEIDLIAKSKNRVHFVEVKYRKLANYGSALEYVTADKSRRLKRAAEAWMSQNDPNGDWQIDVIAISGSFPGISLEYIANAVTD